MGAGGWGSKRFTCPYSLKVKARPPRVQRLATMARISGREGREGAFVILKSVENHEISI